ncbi:hypothetical protein [Leifsonia sp. Le1]|uniref:hypothetical protein n=1 Tax=Leifsonia sp. Le1 TaxID=3404918 RepID=UPI003EC031C6
MHIPSRLYALPAVLAAAALLLAGASPVTAAEAAPAPVSTLSATDSATSGRVPFYGVNANERLHRLAGTPDPRYVKALRVITDLGVSVVRSSIVCPTVEGSGIRRDLLPVSSQNDCQAYSDRNAVDDAVAAAKFAADLSPVQVAPLVQISYPVNDGLSAAADLEWRAEYYELLGEHLGRTLGDTAPYFELGNEPDDKCLLEEDRPAGLATGDYDAACVSRVRVSVLALQKGIRSVAPAAKFAVGTTGMRWGITDALWQGIDPATGQASEPAVRWDYTVVHWYYRDGFHTTLADADPDANAGTFGFHNPRDISQKQSAGPLSKNPAAAFRDKYRVPLLITEFGVNTHYTDLSTKTIYEFASAQNRVGSFHRILNDLYTNAEQYDIAGLTAFALADEPASATASGEYGLTRWDAGTAGYATDDTRPYADYQKFIAAHPALDHAKLQIASPVNGQVLPAESGPVVLTGTGNPGWKVTVAVAGIDDAGCTVAVSPDGAWTCRLAAGLGTGTFLLTTTQSNPDSTFTSVGIDVNIHVGSYTPATVTSPTTTSFGVAPRPVFSGAGQPGLTVTVTGNSGRQICGGIVRTDGTWTCSPDFDMAASDYVSYLKQAADPSTRIDYRLVSARPTVLSSPANDGHVPTDGPGTTSTTAPTFSGTATPGTAVSVAGNSGRVLCATTSAPAGDWSCVSTVPLARGRYLGTVTQNAPGEAPAGFAFTVVTRAAVTDPAEGGRLERDRLTFRGTADPATTVEILGNSGKLICGPTAPDATGSWACTSELDLGVGDYISFLQQSVGGVPVSDAVRFTYTVGK